MRADNAAFLNTTLEGDFMVEVSFDLHPVQQFDQAGACACGALLSKHELS